VSKAATYQYSEQFQRRIAALCLQDITFLRDFGDVIDPKFFDYDYLSSILKVSLNLVIKHNQLPSHALLAEEIKEFCDKYHVGGESKTEILDQLRELYEIDLTSDVEAVKERVVRFGKRQSLKSAVMEVADLIDKDDEFDKASEIVSKALAVGENTGKLGLQVFGKFNSLPDIAVNSPQYGKRTKIPTRLSRLDRALNGGPGCGETWIMMGLPGSGKSQCLVNFGAIAVNELHPTVHVTIGDLDEIDVGIRYAARLTGLPMIEVIQGSDRYKRRAQKLDELLEHYLRVKFFPSATATPQTVRSYLQKLRTVDGITPEMLIIDYPDEFKPYIDNDYQNMGRIYSEIGAISSEFSTLTWVASQVQRWKPDHDSDVITMNNIADSWRKAAKADGICSFNQTIREYERNQARIYVDKVRRGERMYIVKVHTEFDKAYIRELTPEELEKSQLEDEE